MKQSRLIVLSVVTAAFVSGFPVFQRLVLLPAYLNGETDRVSSWINRLSTMVILPGKIVIYRLWPPQEHYFSTPQLLAAAALCLLFYFLMALFVFRIIVRWRGRERKRVTAQSAAGEPAAHEAPVSPDRRAFLVTAVCSTVGVGAVASGVYSVMIEPGWLTVRRLTVPVKDLPPSLNGVTIAQLSDFHHDEWISIEHVRDAVRLANKLQPDVMVLTGDYVTSSPALIKPAVQALAELKPRIGTVGVLGNHDWWTDVDLTRREFKKIGIPLIDNGRQFITPDRKLVSQADAGFCIGGVGDLWEDAVDPERAFHQVPENMPRILLSHNPDVAEQGEVGAGRHRIDLMLCGHTHGGQVRLPVIGTPIVPSAYGGKYAQGMVQGPACRVQISAGIGLAMLPIRFNVSPEIVLITLQTG